MLVSVYVIDKNNVTISEWSEENPNWSQLKSIIEHIKETYPNCDRVQINIWP